ncbi:DMT family transporter [Paenibacillus sp. 598K]|uniref:DMT family transporter n=1 Tax=Paenibacillus sp. 598K TaxID=1117987 RepID=UPI000FFEC0FC|nr:DMT family transporter [Paenibacillus sp. 598K]
MKIAEKPRKYKENCLDRACKSCYSEQNFSKRCTDKEPEHAIQKQTYSDHEILQKHRMNYVLVFLTMMSVGIQYVIAGLYARKGSTPSPFVFMLFISLTVIAFYSAYNRFQFSFSKELMGYSLAFGFCFGMAFLFQVLAIQRGGVTLTSLLLSYSLILPTLFGIFVYKDSVTVTFLAGLCLVLLSLFLINYKKRGRADNRANVQTGWLLLALSAFLGNGMCSIIQTSLQKNLAGQYKAEFMISSMAVTIVICVIVLSLRKAYRSFSLRSEGMYGVLCGAFIACTNLLVMLLLVSNLPVSLIFTLISAGSVITTYIASRFIFREKLNTMQNIGLSIGLLSIVLVTI